MFCHFWQKFEKSKWPPFLGRGKFFENCKEYMDLSTVSIKIPQIGIYPVYYNGNNQSFPPIFIGAILNHKNVAIFRDIFVNIIAF